MVESSMDTSFPNAGRVYDYVLGGNHNFEVDRQAAEYMISLVPSTRKWVRMLRMFLQQAVRTLAEEGYTNFLDLASGLPTADHIHAVVPTARVVYVDSDPITVAFARELIGNNPNVRYLQADVRNVGAILGSPDVAEMFGAGQPMCIGFNAVSCFLTHAELQAVMQQLYEWAPAGSKVFTTFETKNPNLSTPKMDQFLGMFDQMGSPYYFLTREECVEFIKPWRPAEGGFRPLAEWLGVEEQITEEDREGVEMEFYGAFLTK